MDQRTNQILFSLLRSAVYGTRLAEEEQEIRLSGELIKELLKTASSHDIDHLIVYALKQNGLIPKEYAGIERSIFKAAYRYEQLKYEYDELCQTLEAAHIPFLPLKGSVLRDYYPEPWMRTSCDIDVLVHEETLERVTDLLVNENGYKYEGKGSHDVSLFSPGGVHIELHYSLVEDGIAKESSSVLNTVWDTVAVKEGYSYWYEMPDDMFYFYHIAHMAKHFENGGCGIRPFIDLWILDNLKGADLKKRDDLLEKGGLLVFAKAARKLSRIWFEDEERDTVSTQMENYILTGGVYGTTTNRITVQQQKKGGKIKYALSRIWIPYDAIKFHYPILQKHPWLMPFMQIRRWFKLVFCGHAKRSLNELKYNSEVSASEADNMQKFLENIGL